MQVENVEKVQEDVAAPGGRAGRRWVLRGLSSHKSCALVSRAAPGGPDPRRMPLITFS